MTALIFGFIFGKPLINVLRKKQGKGQPIRDDGPEGHFSKAGTPTMGGLLIVGALVTSTLVWARLDNPYVWMVLFVTLSYAAIGFADDYIKVFKKNKAVVKAFLDDGGASKDADALKFTCEPADTVAPVGALHVTTA